MTEERLETLAKALRAGVTDEEKQRAWERLELWERKEYLRVARAAYEFFFGKDSEGNVIVPESGAVGKARLVIQHDCGLCAQRHHTICTEACAVTNDCERWQAHRALGGE